MPAMKRFKDVMVMVAISSVMSLGIAGCGNGNTPPTGSVSGSIVVAVKKSPVSGVTVRLLNSAFRPYTRAAALPRFGSYSAMYAANRAAVAATTSTGQNGTYALFNHFAGQQCVLRLMLSVAIQSPRTRYPMVGLPQPPARTPCAARTSCEQNSPARLSARSALSRP